MNGFQQFSLWRHLSRTHIGLGVVTVLLAIAIGFLALYLYADIVATDAAFERGYVITDLTGIERAILLLHTETEHSLHTTPPDLEQLSLRRALLASQMRLALSDTTNSERVVARLQVIQATLTEYDEQLTILAASPAPDQLETVEAILRQRLDEMEREIKEIFNEEEQAFFSQIEQALRLQRTTQTILLILGGLIIIFGSLLVLSLQRVVSSHFSNAYLRLKQEVTERRQAETELRVSSRELAFVNANLQALNTQLQSELVLARRIQQGLLQPPRPQWQGLDVVCRSIPAREVGGDFYAYHGRDRSFTLAIGDVSGKGVSAALLMATSLAHFGSVFATTNSPSELLSHLDQVLVQYTEATRQNCALCYIEVGDGILRVANAGCVPPYIRRATGGVEELEVGGAPLGMGIGSEFGYPALTLKLFPGDLIILTSDGIAEAHVTPSNLFGFDRLKQTIATGPTTSAQAMLDHIQQEVTTFIGDIDLPDDMTMAVVQLPLQNI